MTPHSDTPFFGFVSRLTANFPSQVVVDVTEQCNLCCIHCPHSALEKQGRLSRTLLDPVLNTKLVHEVKSHGSRSCRYLRYTAQGEPLLHPDIFTMVKEAVVHSGTQVNLTTNGTLLTAPAAQKLLDTGVDVVDISVDAFLPETYAAIRRGGNLERTRSHILTLLARKEKGGYQTKIVVSFVTQALNRAESGDFKAYWNAQGCDAVVVRRLHTAAGARPAKGGSLPDRYPCLYPWERLSLGTGGHLYFCPQDWVHGSRVADFRECTIQETWSGRAMQQVRKAHLENDFSGTLLCQHCRDWQHTRWPHQGKGYADLMEAFQPAAAEDIHE